MWICLTFFTAEFGSCCWPRGGMNRVQRMLHTVSARMGLTNDVAVEENNEVVETFRVNAPGQRFTATHGIAMRKGMEKNLVFVVDRPDVNYIAVSSNIALEGEAGGPDKYELYLGYGRPPTPYNYDQKSVVTASESYVGQVLYRYVVENKVELYTTPQTI